MPRFRLSGTNWEGRDWVVSAPVASLAKAVEAFDPTRYPVDGTVASEKHDDNNPNSDHRPKPYSGSGIVRAIDIGVDSFEDGQHLATEIRKDNRVAYVLWNVPDHRQHLHVSMKSTLDADARPFDLSGENDMTPEQEAFLNMLMEKQEKTKTFTKDIVTKDELDARLSAFEVELPSNVVRRGQRVNLVDGVIK